MGDKGRSARRAETQKEAQESYILPQLGVLMTKESARGFVIAVPLFALFGAVVLLPFAFIEYAGLTLAARFAIVAIIGAVAGSVVGFVVGPSLGARRKASQSAGAGPGGAGRPGKAEVAEATGEHEDGRTRRRRTA